MTFVERLKMQHRNARKCINQIRAGEWVPVYNRLKNTHITAERGGLRLWLSNGPPFCDIDDKNYFGILFRFWVYFAASRKLKADADRKAKAERVVPVL